MFSASDLRRPAELLSNRGVRGVYAIQPKDNAIMRWDPDKSDFAPMLPEDNIDDPALRRGPRRFMVDEWDAAADARRARLTIRGRLFGLVPAAAAVRVGGRGIHGLRRVDELLPCRFSKAVLFDQPP